jgi:hypothetical protein
MRLLFKFVLFVFVVSPVIVSAADNEDQCASNIRVFSETKTSRIFAIDIKNANTDKTDALKVLDLIYAKFVPDLKFWLKIKGINARSIKVSEDLSTIELDLKSPEGWHSVRITSQPDRVSYRPFSMAILKGGTWLEIDCKVCAEKSDSGLSLRFEHRRQANGLVGGILSVIKPLIENKFDQADKQMKHIASVFLKLWAKSLEPAPK